MSRKTPTVNLSGKEYATVPERLKLFREDCPNGLIETSPEVKDDGQIIFTARVLKDKAKPDSAEATGHALGKLGQSKAFEKLETIAIGRALATLGYLASGDIASAEEMEDFYEYRETQKKEAIDKLKDAKTIEELKQVFMGLDSLMAEKDVIVAKDARKKELTDENSK